MQRTGFLATAASLCVAGGLAAADSHETECAMSYGVFEGSVPHTDMAECPASLDAGEDAFCRVALLAEVATVFVFSYDTNCLVQSRSFYDDEFSLVIE